MNPLNLLPGAISEMVAAVMDTRCLTKADRYGLMAAIFDDSLPEEERQSVDRLLRFLVRGNIQVVDELSMIL